MYMIEITEDKMESMLDHMSKGIRCFTKVMEYLEEAKTSRHSSDDDDDYDDDGYFHEETHRRKHRMGGRGRYDRY